jgi:iron-sulfur cluster assembly protein
MITITEPAKVKLEELIKEQNLDTTYFLRVGVKGGGCAGLSYVMDFENELQEGDQEFEDKGIKIVCNKKSLLYLVGTELQYSGGLNGKGFEWHNPQSSRTCGCGQSFSI